MTTPSHNDNDNFLSDLTDGRKDGDWKSRYDGEANKEIKKERNYLLILLSVSFSLLTLAGLYYKGCILNTDCSFIEIKPYVFGIIGGLLGGTIFSMKWLVHSVAKNTWNIDRQLWRILTPLLSATISLLIIVILNSEIFASEVGKSYTSYKSFGIGFLAGYFSDNAIGKLTEIAQVLFGSSSTKSNK